SSGCSGTATVTLSQSPAAGTLVGVGTHTITVTVINAAGDSATCTAIFTVIDTTKPVVTCSVIPTASADGTCQAAVPNVRGAVTVSDTCSATSAITLTQSPAAGTLVGLGVHTITVTATDAAGNSDPKSTTLNFSDTPNPYAVCCVIPTASA